MLSERLMEQCRQYHKTDRGRLIGQYREQVNMCLYMHDYMYTCTSLLFLSYSLSLFLSLSLLQLRALQYTIQDLKQAGAESAQSSEQLQRYCTEVRYTTAYTQQSIVH